MGFRSLVVEVDLSRRPKQNESPLPSQEGRGDKEGVRREGAATASRPFGGGP